MNNNNKKIEHTMTTIYTQNARGLWQLPQDPDRNILVDAPPDLSKVKYIVDYMCQHNVGAWLLQETWEEGDDFNIEIGGYHIFWHNADRGPTGCQHLFQFIAIILSPLFHDAWRLTGSPPPITIDPDKDFAGQLLCLNLKFNSFDPRGKKIKGKLIALALILAYFPCNDQHHDKFCAVLDSMLNSINLNTQIIIIGGDIDARTGTRTCDKQKQVLGP
jgi:hypothetical protein